MSPMPLEADLFWMATRAAAHIFPAAAPLLIAAQILVESRGRSDAVSGAGAVGLMQVTPAAAQSVGVDPQKLGRPWENLTAGIKYLRLQYEHFPEIPSHDERLSFALAAYNGGRAYINKALTLAREACSPGRDDRYGPWQFWSVASGFLFDPRCQVEGKRPDAAQIVAYVAKVRAKFRRLAEEQR